MKATRRVSPHGVFRFESRTWTVLEPYRAKLANQWVTVADADSRVHLDRIALTKQGQVVGFADAPPVVLLGPQAIGEHEFSTARAGRLFTLRWEGEETVHEFDTYESLMQAVTRTINQKDGYSESQTAEVGVSLPARSAAAVD